MLFGTFSTWMNGISNTYFMSAQENSTMNLKSVQMKDDRGNLLFFNEDGSTTTEDTGIPVMTCVPAGAVAIMPMLFEALKVAKTQGGVKAFFSYMWKDPMLRARELKLGSDALMAFLYFLLFQFGLTPAYKEYKKNMQKNPVLQNLVAEVLYKGWSRSYDDFKGPINIMEFVGENMNPPYYTQPVSAVQDLLKVLFGDKNTMYLLSNSTGFGRSFKDTYNAFVKSQK